KKKSKTKCVIM
nr:Chain P, K-RAS4B PEPTIDE SUBSTRATE [synthetic construct]1D8E_P Chain P, K-RAS4B PEPTIDE SUBSTRATE [synthetic construct]1KZO_C Chain C, Farnesylated K-Ras4B peptide product [synthetic construct]1KZP_C Chain C, Farnesylated K-Ras4B peptide product [synthetic construct]1TNO_M Chain M, c-K-ras2 protein isoform b [synthetic construct]1TNO_N Chain N, c-K-ras2 protein isoform b [synthetic construct]1TNO_O Chain O, c-K-ras2 protein isoform b [synthetic construct]1TNO_P Chain P, c-K-ras2 protein i